MRNIEIFEAYSGHLLARLYEHFPLRININAYDIAFDLDDDLWSQSQEEQNNGTHKYNRHKSPIGLSKATIEWLSMSGLIFYESSSGSDFKNVCLTPKGLEAIKAAPEQGNRLLAAAKDLATSSVKDAAKAEFQEVFSSILSWCVKNSPTIIQSVTNLD
ncbi:hypothetical protein F0223_25330 [Vibrio coralliilyticus]|uniref:hypothetical protein n=1 Tax=Vibrio coralliilyticus TaxID=190893 RepID=UPI000503CA58|nr:hypothetical protein [Vibrio coralliilyticus]KFI09466.1 hypothetical protein IX95_24230 [Vibrio sp. B183]NOI21514.1 hypothetical protein [Vibrio coralliilyticus]